MNPVPNSLSRQGPAMLAYERTRDHVWTASLCAAEASQNTDAMRPFQPTERFLQVLWNEQRFVNRLSTADGRRLQVVVPGTWNVAAGPDFRDAVLCLDGVTITGDVEIHRDTRAWRAHGHDHDPLYGNVVLEAVWELPGTALGTRESPLFCLSAHVDRSCRLLFDELRAELYPYARQVAPGGCAVKWALADDSRVAAVLETAGRARLEDKTIQVQRLAIRRGFGQALYELLFESLGYKANRAAFRELAAAVPLEALRACPDATARQALLFGTAGLLPDPSVVPVLPTRRRHLERLWQCWWQQGRDPLSLSWQRHGTRPCNSPERRLAAGVAWLERALPAPERWLLERAAAAASVSALREALEEAIAVTSPWSKYRDFSAELPGNPRLLGACRIRDMLVNVVLPFLCAAARQRGPQPAEARARALYLALPPLQTNRLFREAVHRFFVPPSRGLHLLRRACLQQGLLEIHRSFCRTLRNDCENCPFRTKLPVADPGAAE